MYGAPTFSNNNNWLRRKLMEGADRPCCLSCSWALAISYSWRGQLVPRTMLAAVMQSVSDRLLSHYFE